MIYLSRKKTMTEKSNPLSNGPYRTPAKIEERLPPKPVYCKNCAYGWWGPAPRHQEACHAPKNYITTQSYACVTTETNKYPAELNKDNFYSWYKPKWWRRLLRIG